MPIVDSSEAAAKRIKITAEPELNDLINEIVGDSKEKKEILRVLVQIIVFTSYHLITDMTAKYFSEEEVPVFDETQLPDLVLQYFVTNFIWQSHCNISPSAEIGKDVISAIILYVHENKPDGWFKYAHSFHGFLFECQFSMGNSIFICSF